MSSTAAVGAVAETGSPLVLLVTLLVFVAVMGVVTFGIERSNQISQILPGLHETTAGPVSVLVFPLIATPWLKADRTEHHAPPESTAAETPLHHQDRR